MPPKKKKVSKKASSSPRGKKVSPREEKKLSEMTAVELVNLQGKAEEKLGKIKIKKRKGGEQKTFDTILADLSTGVDKVSYLNSAEMKGKNEKKLNISDYSSSYAFKLILQFGDAVSEDFCFAASEARRLLNDPEVQAIFEEIDAIGVALKKLEKSPRKSSKKGSPPKEYLETVPGYPVAQGYLRTVPPGYLQTIPIPKGEVSLKGRARKAGCGCSDKE